MDIELIKSSLNNQQRSIFYLPEVDSTLLWAKRNPLVQKGDLFLTDYQSAGYGQLKRHWESPRGQNILMTLIDTPHTDPKLIPQLTLVCGVALALVFQNLGLSIRLKWPNDLYVGSKKLGGILCEIALPLIRLGIGLNINTQPHDFPEALRNQATSTHAELGHLLTRESIIAQFVNQYDIIRKDFDVLGLQAIIKQWNQFSFPVGTRMLLNQDNSSLEVSYLGLDADAFLLVKNGNRTEKILSGNLTLV